MGIALVDLVTRLQNDVPARDSVPSATQYENCVKDAVADYSRRNPMERISTLSIVSGTASYSLPDDFLREIKLDPLVADQGGMIYSGGQLVPTPTGFSERHTIAGLTITFHPTPMYTLDRDLWYAAGHVLDGSSEYADLQDEDAGILMLLAQSQALMLQANKISHDAWQYAVGDERVNKEKLADSLREQAKGLFAQYEEAVENVGGAGKAWGTRATYGIGERGRWG